MDVPIFRYCSLLVQGLCWLGGVIVGIEVLDVWYAGKYRKIVQA